MPLNTASADWLRAFAREQPEDDHDDKKMLLLIADEIDDAYDHLVRVVLSQQWAEAIAAFARTYEDAYNSHLTWLRVNHTEKRPSQHRRAAEREAWRVTERWLDSGSGVARALARLPCAVDVVARTLVRP